MDVYSINPNPMPQSPMTREERARTLNLIMIVAISAIIIGLLYWWTASVTNKPTAITSTTTDVRAQVAAALRNSPVHVSQQEIDSVATQLKSSQVVVTDAEKQSVANALRQAQ
jgi:hypothetical protein